MTSNSRRSRQEEFEDSLVLYGDQMPEPSREPRLGRLTDARAMVRSLTAKGERRLAVALRGDAWTGPDLDDQLHLTAVTMAIAKKLGRDDSRLRELEGPTEHVDAAIHYVWWAWAERTRHRGTYGIQPAREMAWAREEFGVRALLAGVYSVAILLA